MRSVVYGDAFTVVVINKGAVILQIHAGGAAGSTLIIARAGRTVILTESDNVENDRELRQLPHAFDINITTDIH